MGTYWIQIRTLGECGTHKVQQLAILRYEGGPEEPKTPRPTYDEGIVQGKVSIIMISTGHRHVTYLGQIQVVIIAKEESVTHRARVKMVPK